MVEMKKLFRVCSCLALYLVLFACVQNKPQEMPAATLEPAGRIIPEITSTATAEIPTVNSALPTLLPLPTFSFVTPNVENITPQTPQSQQLPDFELTEIPGLLQSALKIETLSNFNRHGLQRISGWSYGFRMVEWLDTNHLLMYPFAGVTNFAGSQGATVYPTVTKLNSKSFWVPHIDPESDYGRLLPPWSSQLGVLIIPESINSVSVYSPDGKLKKSYPGKLLGVSPSGTKILINGNRWIDLANGKVIDFAWDQTYPETSFYDYSRLYFKPIWSADETRVYACCYLYGDAKTGISYSMPYSKISIDGKKVDNYFLLEHFYGNWVLNGAYMLPNWGGALDGSPNFISLFDPAAKTYRNLSAILGLPYSIENGSPPYCGRPSAKNDGRYVWVDCRDGAHLIDLATLTSQTYTSLENDHQWSYDSSIVDDNWSADGNYALLNWDDAERILSTTSKELNTLPEGFNRVWHPTESKLAYLSNKGLTLSILDAQTLSIQKEITLPTWFQEIVWSPDGLHIALLASNSSLWCLDYPSLDNLRELTSPTPEWTHLRYASNENESLIKNVIWSPDSTALAFIGSTDVYIVDAK